MSLETMLRAYAGFFVSWQFHSGIVTTVDPEWVDSPIGESHSAAIRRHIQSLIDGAKKTELHMVEMAADRALLSIDARTTHGALNGMVAEIRSRLTDELSRRKFYYVSEGRVPFYERAINDWTSALVKFQEAGFDIVEAGKCLALSRNTACVFHLMRVAELGLRATARQLKVKSVKNNKPIDWAQWGEILGAIDGKLKAGQQQKAGKKKAAMLQFWAEIRIELGAFKDAWRDHVSHARSQYDRDQARSIYAHVHAFMHRLARGQI